jgi:outer membrane protein OmpA-like peptidoglycan-associated protein
MINNVSIPVLIVPESQANLEKFGFTIENTSENKLSDYTKTKKEYKEIVSSMKNEDGTSISGDFYDVFKTTDFIVPIKKSTNKFYYYLKNNFAIFKVTKLNLYIPPQFSEGKGDNDFPTPTPTPTPPIIIPIELKLDLINAYKFDQVDKGGSSWWRELKPGEEGESGKEQFNNFIEQYKSLKEEYANVWDKYLEFLKNNKVTIYGYASIDRPPTDKEIGHYAGCQGYKNIKDYNQCLSEKRAQQAVKDIVKELPELEGILVPVGGGQTDKFDGKNYLNATSDETYQNRRIYGVFPKYEITP